jgi:hypothetical protein
MQQSVDATIQSLRGAVSAKSDAELARTLGIDQSTISSWRARGSVPQKFVKLVRSAGSSAASGAIDWSTLKAWPELQERSRSIGLLRFTLLRSELARSGDVDRAMGVFMDQKPFWLVMYRAAHDLGVKMHALELEMKTAQALILQDDLRDPDETARRVAKHLAEDIVDNPGMEW